MPIVSSEGPRAGGVTGRTSGAASVMGLSVSWRKGLLCDDRDGSAAVGTLMLGAARDEDFGVSDEACERPGDESAGVARRGNVRVVEHRMPVAAQCAGRSCLRLGEQGDDARP